jgi:hypothetical protein
MTRGVAAPKAKRHQRSLGLPRRAALQRRERALTRGRQDRGSGCSSPNAAPSVSSATAKRPTSGMS